MKMDRRLLEYGDIQKVGWKTETKTLIFLWFFCNGYSGFLAILPPTKKSSPIIFTTILRELPC